MEDDVAKVKLAEIVLRQGELKLAAQLQIAIASDHRSSTFAGLCITLAVAVSGAAVALTKEHQDLNLPLIAAAAVGAAGFLLAAAAAIYVARPGRFWVAGNQPDNWWSDNVDTKPLAESLRKESENYQQRMTKNAEIITGNARLMKRALWIGVATPICSALAWVIARTFA